jgi:hypothetical protein
MNAEQEAQAGRDHRQAARTGAAGLIHRVLGRVLSKMLKQLERFGVPRRICSFMLPLATTSTSTDG